MVQNYHPINRDLDTLKDGNYVVVSMSVRGGDPFLLGCDNNSMIVGTTDPQPRLGHEVFQIRKTAGSSGRSIVSGDTITLSIFPPRLPPRALYWTAPGGGSALTATPRAAGGPGPSQMFQLFVVPQVSEVVHEVSPPMIIAYDPERFSAGAVSLDLPALPNGTEVSLASFFPWVQVPQKITVPEGETVGAFRIRLVPLCGTDLPQYERLLCAQKNDVIVTGTEEVLQSSAATQFQVFAGGDNPYVNIRLPNNPVFVDPAHPNDPVQVRAGIFLEPGAPVASVSVTVAPLTPNLQFNPLNVQLQSGQVTDLNFGATRGCGVISVMITNPQVTCNNPLFAVMVVAAP
jgi:hypothetical protein